MSWLLRADFFGKMHHSTWRTKCRTATGCRPLCGSMSFFVEKLVSQAELWEVVPARRGNLGSTLLQPLCRLGSSETVVQVRLWAALDGRESVPDLETRSRRTRPVGVSAQRLASPLQLQQELRHAGKMRPLAALESQLRPGPPEVAFTLQLSRHMR